MQARIIGPEERETYNRFVAEHPKGHILQSYEWGEIKAKTGWQPIRLVLEEGGRLVGAISLLKRRIPGIKKYIFYAPRGPVLDLADEQAWKVLLEAVKAQAQEHGAIFLKLDPDVPAENREFSGFLRRLGFRAAGKGEGFEGIQPRFVFRLDLSPDLEEIFQNFHQKTRYNIRLAEKRGVEIQDQCSKEDLPVFYQVLKETTERDKFLVRSYEYFEDLWDYLVPQGLARLFLARYQGEVIAGTLAFRMGDKAWYIYGASSNRHRNVMPNYLLQWTMIRWAKELGCTLYDFRGVPGNLQEDNPLYGLFRFKKGFNGKYTEFVGEYDLVYSPLYYWLWRTAEPLYSKSLRHLVRLKKLLRGEKQGAEAKMAGE